MFFLLLPSVVLRAEEIWSTHYPSCANGGLVQMCAYPRSVDESSLADREFVRLS
jgi:hypothetical protein